MDYKEATVTEWLRIRNAELWAEELAVRELQKDMADM